MKPGRGIREVSAPGCNTSVLRIMPKPKNSIPFLLLLLTSFFCRMQAFFRQLILVPAFLLFGIHVQAQKRNYTIAEATNGIVTTLRPQALSQPAFRPGTQELYYLKTDSDGTRYEFVVGSKDNKKVRTTLKSFNTQVFE